VKRPTGFTLIEMTVALALLGFIAVLVFESLRVGQRSYETATRRGAASWQVFATQRLFRNLLETAYPQQPDSAAIRAEPAFQGEAQRVSFIAAAPFAIGEAGLYRYEISLRPDDAGSNDLVIRWRAQSANDSVHVGAEEILLERVATFQVSYRNGADWLQHWGESGLPPLVRLQVTFAAGDSRRWPDLIVAPRITDDANCSFDVVARRCRGSA
jgi:general secretion pathway protein J